MSAFLSNMYTPNRASTPTPTENYESLRNLLERCENEIDSVVAFLKQKRELEEYYAKEVEKLARHGDFGSEANPDGRKTQSVCDAWSRLILTSVDVANGHRDRARNYDIIINDVLLGVRDTYKKIVREVKTNIKAAFTPYEEMKEYALAKLRKSYQKKWEELLKVKAIQANGNGTGSNGTAVQNINAITKLQTDFQNAEHGYRLGVQSLEERRKVLVDVLIIARQRLAQAEEQRIKALSAAFERIQYNEAQFLLGQSVLLNQLDKMVESVKVDADCAVYAASVEQAFPIPETTEYENIQVGKSKDLAFGISLINLAKSRGRNVPFIVEELSKIIEERGINTVGIYRVSGRSSELDNIRISLEKDEHNVEELRADTADIHSISGVLKLFFRELPDPVFLFPYQDRTAYCRMEESQRIPLLRARVQTQHPVHRDVLQFIIKHLKKIADHESENQMSMSNLSKIWTTLLFSSHVPVTQKKEAKKSVQEHMDEFVLSGIIIEDLAKYYSQVFEEAPLNMSHADTNGVRSVPQTYPRSSSLPASSIEPEVISTSLSDLNIEEKGVERKESASQNIPLS